MTKAVRQLVLLCSALMAVGCTGGVTGQVDPLEPQTGFASLPANCPAALDPLADAVRSFVGDLYDSPVSAVPDTRIDGAYGQSMTCAARYAQSLPDEPVGSARMPMARGFYVSYDLSHGPRYSGTATTTPLREEHSDDERRSEAVQLSGIGDDAISWVEQGLVAVEVAVKVRYRNMLVTVHTHGKDWQEFSTTRPVGDTPELRQDLLDGATAIATAIVRHAESSLPTAALESLSDSSAPRTTTSSAAPTTTPPRPTWSSCEIAESRIIAAGLSPEDERTIAEGAACGWRQSWYEIEISATGSSIESEVYTYDTYDDLKLVTFDGRPALVFEWKNSGYFCEAVFDVSQGRGADPGSVWIKASADTDSRQTELCAELTKVAEAVAGAIPRSW